MLHEVQKMYDGNKNLQKFINTAVERTMVQIARAHRKDDMAFGRQVVQEFSDYALDTIVSQHEEIERNQAALVELQQHAQKLEDDLAALKGDNFKLKSDIQNLRGSRVIGRIIKAREKVGQAKGSARGIPMYAVSKSKRAISKVSPEFVKPVIRYTVLRPARKLIRLTQRQNEWEKYRTSAKHVLVDNSKWAADKPLVTVVVPYFNRADTIDETLQSLQNQTFQDFETILVNDGSTDQISVDKLSQIKKDYPFVKVIDQENQGVARARNNGIKLSKGKYVICLDSDDIIDPTYVEKCTIELEAYPQVGLVTTYKKDFGVSTEAYHIVPYNPLGLYDNNMVITAAEFRKEAWQKSGGYKSDLGYEDWDYWLSLAEHGYWGKLIPEELFHYRVALASRFTEDKEVHWNNIKKIHQMHPGYKSKIKKLLNQRVTTRFATPTTAFINVQKKEQYLQAAKKKPRVLITLPWMTFGGAESLVVNYCYQIKNDFDISFVTGLKSEHEWEYKFREITPNIYHLANMFDDPGLQLEFVSNYIQTRGIDVLHIVHHGVLFPMLPELKKRYPRLKVIVTMFNTVAEQFSLSTNYKDYIDVYTSDNAKVIHRYCEILGNDITTRVIPNGIDCSDVFRLDLFNRDEVRENLGLQKDELAVFFVGRLSEEKNPDVFVHAASQVAKAGNKKAKFFMVGDGGMRTEIEALIESLGPKNVTYLGYQSNVASYLSAADIFVLPSSAEGFPLTRIEAMAMRVVVVASDVGAVADVVENGTDGFVVTPGSADEITEAVNTLSADSALLKNMKSRSRKKVEEKYSVVQLGKNYSHLYRGE